MTRIIQILINFYGNKFMNKILINFQYYIELFKLLIQ